MGVQVGFLVGRVGSAGRPAWFWRLSDIRTSNYPGRQAAFPHVRETYGVRLREINIGVIAYGAMWGYGVGPPSLWNPSIGE